MIKNRGISPIVATIIVVAISIAVAIAVSLWMSGIVGYFTRIENIKISEMTSFGPAVVVYFSNHGTKESYITSCWINGKYEAKIIAAYNPQTRENYLHVSKDGETMALVPPGGSSEVWMIVPFYFEPGVSVRITCTTSYGYTFYRESKVYQQFQKIGFIRLVAYTSCSGYPNVKKRIIEIDPILWHYNYTYWSAPDANGDRTLLVHYEGDIPVLRGISEAWSKDVNNKNPNSPVVIVINPKAGIDDWDFTWHGWKSACGGWAVNYTLHLEKIDNAVPGLDFLIFWEDLWWKPGYTNPGDANSWTDHIVRVTWMRSGVVRVAVYHASGCYYHEFWIGDTHYYDKGHGVSMDCCSCGPSCGGVCNSCSGSCPYGTDRCKYYIPYPCLTVEKRP